MAFAAIAALSNCSQNEEFALDNGQSSYDKNAVTFGTYLGQSPKTRATVTDIDVMKGDTYPGFGVFAYNTGTSAFADASNPVPNFMCNTPVTWQSTEWAYTDVKQWPEGAMVSFFAYAPYIATAGENNITALPSETTAGAPVLPFKVDTDAGKQIDLLYADAKTDQTKEMNGGKVQFLFKHALSCVGFKAKLDGEVSDDIQSITITDIVLKSSDFSVSADLDLRTGEWGNHTTQAMEYAFSADDFIAGSNVFGPADAATGDTPVQLTGDGKYLMLIPTATGSKASMEITVNYMEETSAGEKKTYRVQAAFEQEFKKGMAYNFVLSISSASLDEPIPNVSFDVVKVEQWDNPDAPESNDVPVMSADHKMSTVIIHPDNGMDDPLIGMARFKHGSSHFIVNMSYAGEKSKFVIPDFQIARWDADTNPAPYLLEAEDDEGGLLILHGWIKEKIPVWLETDDTPREQIAPYYGDKYIPKCAEIEITEGETLHLYPIYIKEGF